MGIHRVDAHLLRAKPWCIQNAPCPIFAYLRSLEAAIACAKVGNLRAGYTNPGFVPMRNSPALFDQRVDGEAAVRVTRRAERHTR